MLRCDCAVIQWINRTIFKKWASYILFKEIARIYAELRNVVGTVSSGGFILDELTWQKPVRSVSIDRSALHKGKLMYGGTKAVSVQIEKH